ncbi:hypothetical protein ACFYUD_29130 [Nocardia tengchongensis]|uniref:hypothetical protein n=1 Tax=Nocardia tengchongensis TaxID=2055889 RepID=UPI00369EC3D7
MRMTQRMTVGLSVAALISAGLGVLAPQASAWNIREVAPGLTCGDDFYCHNSTDDVYFVTARVTCSIGGGVHETRSRIGRGLTERVKTDCSSYTKPGGYHIESTMDKDGWHHKRVEDPGTLESTFPVGVEYLHAETGPDTVPAPSGSAG